MACGPSGCGLNISGICFLLLFFPPKKVSRACTWRACCKISTTTRRTRAAGRARVFSAGCFFSFFQVTFFSLLHSMICIVGLLELDRAFHRREFVSFLYAQQRTRWRCESVAYHIVISYPFLYFLLFFCLSFVLEGGGLGWE